MVRSAFLEINDSFEKLEYKEKIPLPDDPEVAVSFDHLRRLEKEGRDEVYPDGAKHPYKVKELLGTLFVERTPTKEEFIEILRKVISESDTEKKALEKAGNVLIMQPNFMGLGIDLKEAVKAVFGKPKRAPRQRGKK